MCDVTVFTVQGCLLFLWLFWRFWLLAPIYPSAIHIHLDVISEALLLGRDGYLRADGNEGAAPGSCSTICWYWRSVWWGIFFFLSVNEVMHFLSTHKLSSFWNYLLRPYHVAFCVSWPFKKTSDPYCFSHTLTQFLICIPCLFSESWPFVSHRIRM